MNRRSIFVAIGSFFVGLVAAPAALLARRRRKPNMSCKDCEKCDSRCRCNCRRRCKCRRRPEGCTCEVPDSKVCRHPECRRRKSRNISNKIRNSQRCFKSHDERDSHSRREIACPDCQKRHNRGENGDVIH